MTDVCLTDCVRIIKVEQDGKYNAVEFSNDSLDLRITTSNWTDDKSMYNWNRFYNNMLNIKYLCNGIVDYSQMVLIKTGGLNELEHNNYSVSLVDDDYEFNRSTRTRNRQLLMPDVEMTRCQNCDTYFPTKYQYQRHQCEFNAAKIILKPDITGKEPNEPIKTRFECDTCKKSFISASNLERHKTSHDKDKKNTCEYCNKSFVTDNRLRIHKENHCKKAGDMTKFYRSDVVVWSCKGCKRIFANEKSGLKHAGICKTENVIVEAPKINETIEHKETILNIKSIFPENNFDANFEKAITSQSGTLGFYKDTKLDKPLEKILTEMLYQCEFCNRVFASKENVIHHQGTHTTEKNYECVFCEEKFNSYTQAVGHWQNKCNDESNWFFLPKMVYCEQCDKGYKSHEILYIHKNKKKHYSSKIWTKSEPEEGKGDDKAIVKFIQTMMKKYEESGTVDVKKEDENNDSIETNSAITVPLKTNENGRKKRGRKRKNQAVEEKNKLALDDGHAYQCERCAIVYSDITTMDTHKEREHVSTFCCEECGQVLHSQKALMIHCRAHQSLKPYVCDQCGRSYSQTSHLWQHMRFHQGIKPFACPHEGCEARYTIRPDLKDHIRKVHTRERPFKCSVCQKCFLTGSVYYQHRLIHTNDRRYGCEICQKRFFRADALNNHRRIHTDERPYPCPVCGREFRQKGDRNKHVRTQHPI